VRWFASDLHVHSVLSPCGDLSMSPRTIVGCARKVGLDVVAVTDHNCARNAPALSQAARAAGVVALYGLEVRSVEEVDLLTIFDRVEAALEFGAVVYDALPDVPCDPDLFGDQVVVDADEEILESVDKLLISGCSWPLAELAHEARERGGLVIPAHVDRPVDSVISQLGWLPDDLEVDAVELSRFGDETVLSQDHPWLARVPVVRFSDAHRPAEIGYQQTRFLVAEPTVSELRLALAGEGGRRAEPVRRALG
jgi:hypothetical protein